MSLWIPLFTDFTSHPKTVKLRRALNIQTAEAFVIRLWLWCAEHYPNGFPDKEVLEEACLWKGKAGGLIEALTSVGFLDTSGELHGWSDRAGAHLVRIEEKRRADRARKSRGVPSEFQRKSHGTPSEVATQIEKEKEREKEKEKEKEKEREGDPSDLSGRPADDPDKPSPKSSAKLLAEPKGVRVSGSAEARSILDFLDGQLKRRYPELPITDPAKRPVDHIRCAEKLKSQYPDLRRLKFAIEWGLDDQKYFATKLTDMVKVLGFSRQLITESADAWRKLESVYVPE